MLSDSMGVSNPHGHQQESVLIRAVRPGNAGPDAAAVSAIYNHYVTESVVTFEERPVSAGEISRRMARVQAAALPWLVAELSGTVVGYAYAAPWKKRPGYRCSTEVSVYTAPGRERLGIGTALFACLLPELEQRGMHVALSGITLPNTASVALHQKFGFRKVAHLAEAGFKFGRWIDVGYWQLTFGVS